jgi:hypothetical protein
LTLAELSFDYIAVWKGLYKMLTAAQQHAVDRFSKGLLALSDDALIDTYHQATDDLRAAPAEGSDNLSKAHAQTLATEKAMRDRFPDYRTRYKMRTPEQPRPHHHSGEHAPGDEQGAEFPITIHPERLNPLTYCAWTMLSKKRM